MAGGPMTQGQPSEAASAPGTPTAQLVVHPSTGEYLGDAHALEQAPPELLADAFAAIERRMSELREMRKLLDHELARRLDIKDRKRWTWGDYEVSLEGGRRREWDGDQLEQVVRDLVDAGVIGAGEVTDLIRHETNVSGTAGNKLRARLSGASLRAVDDCWTWQDGRRRLEVVRSLPLIPEGGLEGE